MFIFPEAISSFERPNTQQDLLICIAPFTKTLPLPPLGLQKHLKAVSLRRVVVPWPPHKIVINLPQILKRRTISWLARSFGTNRHTDIQTNILLLLYKDISSLSIQVFRQFLCGYQNKNFTCCAAPPPKRAKGFPWLPKIFLNSSSGSMLDLKFQSWACPNPPPPPPIPPNDSPKNKDNYAAI